MTSSEIASVLNDLIQTSMDGQKGFEKSAAEIPDDELREILQARAEDCRGAVAELQNCVRSYNEEPETEGSAMGALHRGWVDLKTALAGRDTVAILSECERGEDVAKASYKKALDNPLPSDVRMLVERQYQGALRNHDQIRALRDRYKTAHA